MIVVNLKGGLGNQLFQYAAGLALAKYHNTDLKLDLSWFNSELAVLYQRTYCLNHYKISSQIATESDILKFTKYHWPLLLRVFYKKYESKKRYFRRQIFKEKHIYYDDNYFQTNSSVLIDGYWQSEKYFNNISDIILKEFQIKYPIGSKNKHLVQKILETVSIGVHLRIGDYYTNKNTNALHGILSRMYYKKCLDYVSTYLDKPIFFIFSDDPEYAKNYLGNIATKENIIYSKCGKNYEDLTLMSLCKHQIIANSTFSWWAAWLNKNPDKIVVAPKQWYANKDFNNQTGDLIPNHWKRL